MLKIWLAFATVYLIWGSTYLAIRFGVAAAPPFLFAGVRLLASGALLLAVVWWRGGTRPTRSDWRTIVLTGLLMLVGGNGLVTYCEQWVASNQAALLVATSAFWIPAFGAGGGKGEHLSPLTLAGLLLGFGGVAALVGEGLTAHAGPTFAYLALIVSPICWALGSVYGRRHPAGCSPLMVAACQMLVAGAVLLTGGLAAGEGPDWHWTTQMLWPLLYLIVLGSCVAYSAYIWLVQQVTPAQLSTYAYVNPAVAVLLGWWLADEHLSRMQVLGTAVILAGVVVVTLAQSMPRRRAPVPTVVDQRS